MKLLCREKDGKIIQYMLTVPKAIAEAKGWQPGTELTFTFNEKGKIVIEEKKVKKNPRK